MHRVGAITLDEAEQAAFGTVAGRNLGPQIAEHLDGYADIHLDKAKDCFVRHAPLIELEERDADAFLKDLGGVDGRPARRQTTDVGVMDERGRETLDGVVAEDRLHDIDIGKMHAAAAIGIIEREDVAGIDPAL